MVIKLPRLAVNDTRQQELELLSGAGTMIMDTSTSILSKMFSTFPSHLLIVSVLLSSQNSYRIKKEQELIRSS